MTQINTNRLFDAPRVRLQSVCVYVADAPALPSERDPHAEALLRATWGDDPMLPRECERGCIDADAPLCVRCWDSLTR